MLSNIEIDTVTLETNGFDVRIYNSTDFGILSFIYILAAVISFIGAIKANYAIVKNS